MTFVQITFPVDAAQAARNGAGAPPAVPGSRSHQGRPCARCARLSASPTAPASGARCTSCRFAADRARETRDLLCGRTR